ncbi:GNAT family N-acetyltransferase [Streptomyces coeruleorubidus]|uniref:GNAT family N-acetyltransferase n=1 Tax=Streptomyces coeruleorubidus TaxID=116188 RepID=UPI0036FB97D5
MPHHKIGAYFSVKGAMLHGDHRHALAEEDGECIGLAAASYRSSRTRDFLYIETLLVSEDHQGSPVTGQLLAALFGGIVKERGEFPDLIAMKTYNARAYVLMRSFVEPGSGALFYPEVDRDNSAAAEEMAAEIAEALGAGFDFDATHGVVPGGGGEVPGDFWPHFPASRDDRVNEFFRRHLTPQDRLLCFIDSSTAESKRSICSRLGI